MATKVWEVSDEFWSKVETLIPKIRRDPDKEYRRRRGGGRKPMESRKIFEAIVYVLRTGIQWKALPKEYGPVAYTVIFANGKKLVSFASSGGRGFLNMVI